MLIKDILRIPLVVDPSVMHGSEAGKALAALDLAKETYEYLPSIPRLVSRRAVMEGKNTSPREHMGRSYRPDSISDIFVHETLVRQMVREDPWQHINAHVDVAYQIACECLHNRAFDKGGRIQHEAIGNAGYLNAYLVPAGFVAWGVSWKKAITIFHAALLTKSRTFFLAMGAGILAYTIKGLRPPIFALAIPFLAPLLFFKSFKKLRRIFHWEDSARRGFRRVIKAAKKDGKVFGYGNFSEAIEEYFDEYLGPNPIGQTYSEAWSDKAHAEFKEWDVTFGEKIAKDLRSIYWQWLKKAQKPWLAGALSAHMACLSTLFRTEAASIQEDFLVALIEAPGTEMSLNSFHRYYKLNRRHFEAREYKWKANLAAHLALSEGTEEQMLQALRMRPITLEGQLKIPTNITPEVAYALKKAYEWDIEQHPSAERMFRYWWLLRYFHDPDEPLWRARAMKASPNRMKHEIKNHPVQL